MSCQKNVIKKNVMSKNIVSKNVMSKNVMTKNVIKIDLEVTINRIDNISSYYKRLASYCHFGHHIVISGTKKKEKKAITYLTLQLN